MNKQILWILVVAALLVGAFGGYYYEKTKLMKMVVMVQSQLDTAKMENAKLMKDQSMKNDTIMKITPSLSGMMHESPTGAMMEK